MRDVIPKEVENVYLRAAHSHGARYFTCGGRDGVGWVLNALRVLAFEDAANIKNGVEIIAREVHNLLTN
jgi:hypothetical protein